MVSIASLSSAQASNYYQRDSYYTQSQGEWQGKGAEELGLTGSIEKADFDKLIQGIAPNGEFKIQGGGEKQNHRAGIDLTFSAPKSVSIASEVLGDTRIADAHEKAVAETLKWIEDNFSHARQTQECVTEKINTGNLIIAKFQHNTSRELDPQLHTHAVIMNITQRPDGEWRALSNETIFQNKMFIGQFFRNELAKNLTELGFKLETDSKGFFEIKGIEKEVLSEFSQRTNQIQEKANELREKFSENINQSKLKEFATLDSRQAKRNVNMEHVKEQWVERLENIGYTKEDILSSIASQVKKDKSINNEYDYIRQAVSILTENESTFSREKALLTASKLALGEYNTKQLNNAFNELLKDKDIKQFNQNIFSTREMEKIENNIIKEVFSSQNKLNSISTQETISQSIQAFESLKGYSLTVGQKEAVNHILLTRDRFVAIQGDAGTGKTTVLDAVNRIAKEQGYNMRGLAQTGKASDEIEKASGIKSQTIDSFLKDKEKSIGRNEIWVVDEASMLGSKKMNELIKTATENNARVVLIGDTKQLQSIEAGGIFGKLQEKGISTVRMSEVQRQRDASYLSTVKDFSEKKFDSAMQKLQEKNRIHEITDRQERIDAIVEKYTQDFRNTILVTATNKDRQELNQTIRDELKEQGKIGEQNFTFTVRESRNLSEEQKRYAQSFQEGDILIQRGKEYRVLEKDIVNHSLLVKDKNGNTRDFDLRSVGSFSVFSEKEQSFSVGEKIVFLKNDKGLKVKNGQTAFIENIDETGKITLSMENGEEKTININSQYNYIEQGYAITDYKSQGQTEKTVIYNADTNKEVNFNQVYVGMTRGKYDCQIFTDSIEQFSEQMKAEQTKTSTLDFKEKQNDQQPNDQMVGEEKGIFGESIFDREEDRQNDQTNDLPNDQTVGEEKGIFGESIFDREEDRQNDQTNDLPNDQTNDKEIEPPDATDELENLFSSEGKDKEKEEEKTEQEELFERILGTAPDEATVDVRESADGGGADGGDGGGGDGGGGDGGGGGGGD